MNTISVITTNAIGFPPFIFHKAIRFRGQNNEPMIIHNTTSGLEIINYPHFKERRRIYKTENYQVKNFDPEKVVKEGGKKFNWLTNNCEDFTSRVVNEYSDKRSIPASPQRAFWVTLAIGLLLTVIAVKA